MTQEVNAAVEAAWTTRMWATLIDARLGERSVATRIATARAQRAQERVEELMRLRTGGVRF